MKTNLKPCPFCGSKDITINREGTKRVSTIISCNECGIELESNEADANIGKQWNERDETPKWNDASKIKPRISNYDETFFVLVCDKSGFIYTAQYMQTFIDPEDDELPKWFQFGRDSYEVDDIKYWMELPKLPSKTI